MEDVLVSILIPTYNREAFIAETLESAISQTHKNIEIIIVDNASSDSTWKIIQQFADRDQRIRALRNDFNVGPVKNWEKCINLTRGEFCKILWSDDLISSDFIEKTLPYLINNNEIGFVYTGVNIFINGSDKSSDQYFIGKTGTYPTEKYIEGVLFSNEYPYSPGCALFRYKDLRESLFVNIPSKIKSDFSQHAIGNDLLIFLLISNKYKNFAFINEKLSYFRSHSNSISVESVRGKLPLHYDLVKAYFVENYRAEYIKKLNVFLFLHLLYFTDSELYKLKRVKDFYIKNTIYRLDFIYLIKVIFYIVPRIFFIKIKNKIYI